MDEQVTPTWSAVEAIPIAVAALVAAALLGVLATLAVPDDLDILLAGLLLEACLGTITVAWVRLRYPGSFPALGLSSRRLLPDLGAGFLSGLGLFLGAVFVVMPIVTVAISLVTGDPVNVPEQEIGLEEGPSALAVALGGVAAIIAAPIAEELFFRGFLFGALRRRRSFAVAGSISAAIFAAFHVIPLLMPLFFVVGLGLAYVYERRGSLLASMAAHVGFNVIGYTFLVRSLL